MASEDKVRHGSIENTQNACALKAQHSRSRHQLFIQNTAQKKKGYSVIVFSHSWFINIIKKNPGRRADPKKLLALSCMSTPPDVKPFVVQ